jgi:hypothetical protein
MQVVLTGLLDTLKDNMPCANAEATMCIGTHTLYRKIIKKEFQEKVVLICWTSYSLP